MTPVQGARRKFRAWAVALCVAAAGIAAVSGAACTDASAADPARSAVAGAGNRAPFVSIHFGGNRTFLWHRTPLLYQVVVSDWEDGDTLGGGIDPAGVAVALHHVPDGQPGFPPVAADAGLVRAIVPGKRLIARQDCVLCHIVSGDHRIPTYEAIALMYGDELLALEALAEKVVKGGTGKWGRTEMPAHPTITLADARRMVSYILTQAREEARVDWRPVRGEILVDYDAAKVPAGPFGLRHAGRWVLSANYTDRGAAGVKPQTAQAATVLRPPSLLATERDEGSGIIESAVPGGTLAVATQRRSTLKFAGIDLTGVRQIGFVVGDLREDWAGGVIEVRAGTAVGPVLGRAEVRSDNSPPSTTVVATAVTATEGVHDLHVVLRGNPDERRGTVALGALTFQR